MQEEPPFRTPVLRSPDKIFLLSSSLLAILFLPRSYVLGIGASSVVGVNRKTVCDWDDAFNASTTTSLASIHAIHISSRLAIVLKLALEEFFRTELV